MNGRQRSLERKVSDEFNIPLCKGHHREVHRYGGAIWWGEVRIDAVAAARVLWLKTHPLPVTIEKTVHLSESRQSRPTLNNAISETKPITAGGGR
jgi:hypothetical protein